MLRIDQLSKSYDRRWAVQDLSLHLRPGEVYGLLGPNGAGKTTTINLICNLLRPDRGQITIDDQPVSARTKAWVGVVPQANLLYRSLTCREHLQFFADLYGVPRAQRAERIERCLAAVNLTDRTHHGVETLSGGMQRRLSLAIALVHHPKVLILDEPTTGLDIEARYDLWQLIRQLQRQGMTILLTTHLLDEAERLCDRIGIIKAGRLLAEGSLAELQRYVPAAEIAILTTLAEEQAIAQAEAQGFTPRRYGTELAFWLPEPLDLPTLIQKFAGVPLESIARQPVRLEHIYLEVLQQQSPPEDSSGS